MFLLNFFISQFEVSEILFSRTALGVYEQSSFTEKRLWKALDNFFPGNI